MSFWEHDLRIERILAWEEGLSYPRCIAGTRASPPEFLNGPEHYLRCSLPYTFLKGGYRIGYSKFRPKNKEYQNERQPHPLL